MEKIKIVLDTDMGSDCDDAGALAVLHNLAKIGEAEVLAAVHCCSEISGAYAVKSINEWYGRQNVPVGRYDKKKFLEGGVYSKYTKPIMEKYLQTHATQKFENATRVLRKTLSENDDVTIVVIGMLNNIAELLKSEADDISMYSGLELVEKSVKKMYVMGGNFADLTYAEYNIKCDVESARFVSENFPRLIVYCGFETGCNIITGKQLKDADENHPVRMAYYLHGKRLDKNLMLRFSWDPITVYCAVRQNNPFYKESKKLKIGFNQNGCVKLDDGGKDCYIIQNAADTEIENEIDRFLK